MKELKNSTDDNDAVPITSSDLQIMKVRFAINGSDGSMAGSGCTGHADQCGASTIDMSQPRVTILLDVKIPGDQEPDRIIQTTVSERNLNVK
jgi:hypothetical protein